MLIRCLITKLFILCVCSFGFWARLLYFSSAHFFTLRLNRWCRKTVISSNLGFISLRVRAKAVRTRKQTLKSQPPRFAGKPRGCVILSAPLRERRLRVVSKPITSTVFLLLHPHRTQTPNPDVLSFLANPKPHYEFRLKRRILRFVFLPGVHPVLKKNKSMLFQIKMTHDLVQYRILYILR